ncbi:MAG: putative 4-hydroxy-4-methyl-2-oxoglutarate aldolase [Saccharospirillum sp.]
MWNTPDLCDEHPNDVLVLESRFQDFGGKPAFFGQVVTVHCYEDNSRVKELASSEGDGKVMVVDGGASLRKALIGDMIALEAVNHGWQGVVINGCARDIHELKRMPIGVRALASIPLKTDRKGLGEVDVPVTFAGQTIEPGMWLYADETGIVVSQKKLFG